MEENGGIYLCLLRLDGLDILDELRKFGFAILNHRQCIGSDISFYLKFLSQAGFLLF